MKLYIAAPWEKKAAARVARGYCLRRDIHVTSTWVDQPDDENDKVHPTYNTREGYAVSDWNEVLAADALVLLFPEIRSSGKATEMGAMLALGRPTVIVHPSKEPPMGNIFYNLPQIHWEDTLPHAIDWLLNDRLVMD